jgi:hypothetical protein
MISVSTCQRAHLDWNQTAQDDNVPLRRVAFYIISIFQTRLRRHFRYIRAASINVFTILDLRLQRWQRAAKSLAI